MSRLFLVVIIIIPFLYSLISCGGQLASNGQRTDGSDSTETSLDWDFTSSVNYTYLNNKIEFINGRAHIRTVPLDYASASSFLEGIYEQVVHENGVLKLANNADTSHALSWTPHFSYLTGYWSMENNWEDSSAYGVDGVATGATFNSESVKVGGFSGHFDGDDFVDIADHNGLDSDIADSFTIMLWYRPDSSTRGSLTRILSKACHDTTSYVNSSFQLTQTSANKAQFFMTTDGSTQVSVVSNVDLDFDAWNFIVATYDKASIKLYVNGQLEDTQSETGTLFNSTYPLKMGARLGSASCDSNLQHAHGQFDEFAVFSKSYTAADIQLVYQRQVVKYSGLYTSQIIDTGNSSYVWNALNWTTSLPNYKELPGDTDGNGAPNSESSGQYPDLVGSNGSTSDNNLMSTLIAYYRFNGSTDYIGGANEVEDFSGSNNDGIAIGGTVSPGQGVYYEGRYLAGTGASLSTPSLNGGTTFLGDRTVSMWLKLDVQQVDVTSTTNLIFSEGDGTRNLKLLLNNHSHGTPAEVGKLILRKEDGTMTTEVSTSFSVLDGKYHHIVIHYNSGNLNIFVDGEPATTSVVDSTTGNYTGVNSLIVSDSNDGFSGFIDELAYWKRALHVTEVSQLYLRGANRVKYLVKSCVDSFCNCESLSTVPLGTFNDCDGDGTVNSLDPTDVRVARWKGPDNTGNTFFSELVNNDSISVLGEGNGNVNIVSPSLTFSDFSTSSFNLSQNQYFQFKVLMQSNDKSSSCGGQFCSPEISSINLGSDVKYADVAEISNVSVFNYNSGLSFKSVSLEQTNDVNCSFGYQLSPDNGSTYYYLLSGSWEPITIANEKSSSSSLQAGIQQFSSQFSSGVFKFKVFIESLDATTDCSIDKFSLSF